MSKLTARFVLLGRGLVLPLLCALVLALPVASSGQELPSASVTVCQVTGSASAPSLLEVQVSVDEVAAYLNQFPGSFVGTCPTSGGDSTGGSGEPALTGAVTVCRVSGSASTPILSEVLITADEVAVFLSQNPGSVVGPCPASESGGNAVSSADGTGSLSAVVTVCRVTGTVNAPDIVQFDLAIDQVVAFLNRNPGSFIGTCPGEGGTVTQPPGTILGIPAGSALTICKVTANATGLELVQVNVAIDRVAAFLNQNPGSFVGLCPSVTDSSGTVGNEPLGYVTICRVTGDADNPLAPITIQVSELGVYLTRAGTIVPAPTAGCPGLDTDPGGGGDGDGTGGGAEPSTTTPGETTTIAVQTTPNTVVTATGAGVNESTKSDAKGKATLKVKPKKKGIVTVRAAGDRAVKRVGVVAPRRTARNLTG